MEDVEAADDDISFGGDVRTLCVGLIWFGMCGVKGVVYVCTHHPDLPIPFE